MVAQKEAAIIEVEQGAKELGASFDQGSAATSKAKAQIALAQQTYDRQVELLEYQVVAQATVDTASRNLETSVAQLLPCLAMKAPFGGISIVPN